MKSEWKKRWKEVIGNAYSYYQVCFLPFLHPHHFHFYFLHLLNTVLVLPFQDYITSSISSAPTHLFSPSPVTFPSPSLSLSPLLDFVADTMHFVSLWYIISNWNCGYGGKRSASVSYLQPQSIRNACSAPPDLVRNTWPIPPPDIMRNAYPAPPPDFMRNAYAAPPLLHLMRNAQLASPSHPQSSKIQYLLHHSHMCNTFLILSLLLHKFDGNLTI